MTHLLLRADASPTIGVGHVSRMVAFAEQASSRGWSVTFSGTLTSADWFAAQLDELGVAVVPPTDPGDASALPRLASAVEADVVLVDHYGIGEQRAAVNAAGAVLVSLESREFGRRQADVVVESELHDLPRPDDGSPMVLRGPRYAPLREQVRRARRRRARRHSEAAGSGSAPKVVVVLGGGAVWREEVTRTMCALRDTGMAFDAEVVAHGDPEVPETVPGQRFAVSAPDTRLPERLADADLAVSAAGVTLLEACCIGVPTALLLLVDNQEAGYTAAVDAGLAAGLGWASDLASPHALDGAAKALRALLAEPGRRGRMASSAASAVDGLGAARVLDAAVEAKAAAP
ncbi:spore coat protein [Saccharomonospora xinjiangensis]|uniref:spore coat protein n=1 Tax=Saccharomonospora xinjiangensis TaxID=75294 RepID=UPI0010700409|nr:spore coat protein [Saccharomonospora xinjiangensis]QBQ58570.1 UDP-N-acetylglucosamine--N-acetylmuramyl-(pentapeptide) pyrophosphoryl-undecaprenol N-acetylglucosamine transferase [Saccharomonospora xinjiangensis]